MSNLIISKTPLRVSLVGGGTDLKEYYEHHGGAVVTTSIDKYIHIALHKYFDKKFLLKYSATEYVDTVDEIKHPLIRECMRKAGIENGIELTSFSDLSSRGGSGLASSSAFTVSLLKALYEYKGIKSNNYLIAEDACDIEINKCNSPIGKQDQYECAMGGINLIEFLKNGVVNVSKLGLKDETIHSMQENLLMFYTGITRDANVVLKEQTENTKNKMKTLGKMKELSYNLADKLMSGNVDYLGQALHENWLMKRELANGITSEILDSYYHKALDLGATGGKVCGSGGGGFFLFYCDKQYQENLKKNLGLQHFDFKFDEEGSRIILR